MMLELRKGKQSHKGRLMRELCAPPGKLGVHSGLGKICRRGLTR